MQNALTQLDVQNAFDSALVWFFEFMDRPVQKLGYIRANLTLAEDRLLTWAMVMGTGKTNRWVPEAIFTFDAVTSAMDLAKQRRRWNAGTFAGHLWLLSNISRERIPTHDHDDAAEEELQHYQFLDNRIDRRSCGACSCSSCHCWSRCISVLLMLELLKVALNLLSPSMFVMGVSYAFQFILNQVPEVAVDATIQDAVLYSTTALLLVILMAFTVHHSPTGKQVYDPIFFAVAIGIGVFLVIGALGSVVVTIVQELVQWDGEVTVSFSASGDNQTSLSTGETDLAYGKGSYSFIGLSDSFWNQYIVLPNTIVFAEQHPLIVDAMPTRTETLASMTTTFDAILTLAEVSVLIPTIDVLSELNIYEVYQLHNEFEDIEDKGWNNFAPFCNASFAPRPWPSPESCQAATAASNWLAAYTIPQLLDEWHPCENVTVLDSGADIVGTVPTQYGAPIYVFCNKWPAGKQFSVASLCATMWIMFAPLLFSLLTCNFWSLWFLLWGFVPYYLFLPTTVGTFSLYAVAQSYNLTWGNKAHGEDDAVLKGTADMNRRVNGLVAIVVVANVIATVILLILQSPSQAADFTAIFSIINLPGFVITFFFATFINFFHNWCCCYVFRRWNRQRIHAPPNDHGLCCPVLRHKADWHLPAPQLIRIAR